MLIKIRDWIFLSDVYPGSRAGQVFLRSCFAVVRSSLFHPGSNAAVAGLEGVFLTCRVCYSGAAEHFTTFLCPYYRKCFSRKHLNPAGGLYKDCQFPELKKSGSTFPLKLFKLKMK